MDERTERATEALSENARRLGCDLAAGDDRTTIVVLDEASDIAPDLFEALASVSPSRIAVVCMASYAVERHWPAIEATLATPNPEER